MNMLKKRAKYVINWIYNKKGVKMNLTKDKIKSLWKKRDTIYSSNKEIVDRFEDLNQIINDFLSKKINKQYITEFAPSSDRLVTDNSNVNRQKMINEIGEEYTNKMWKLIGGFDGKKVVDKYRIISASLGSNENYYENEIYSTHHRNLWANSNFVTNNYPDQIAKFLQCIKKDENNFDTCINESKIVLTWKTKTYLKDENNAFNESKKRLETRFPPKFLWMWAKKDEVLHPISLMAFREFLKTEYAKDILKSIDENLTPKSLTNMKFDEFKEKWKEISNKIINDFKEEANDTDNLIKELSKFISIISVKETDIKNISDLLQTGNKAVILWGPPGTGKTYESEQVVKELLNIGDDNLEDYLFSTNKQNEKGYYEIIQFHTNYGYEDFIGGISPKLNDNSLGYELREGIFKRFCDEANNNPNLKYIFIIDEINRAELSAVFGELLYALEYRGKSINLPHFDKFTIPENVYIIGTMNNVDKSLVSFDLALRRRFGFFKLMPKLEVIQEVLSDIIEENSLNEFYKKAVNLNKQITEELNLTEDYQIGQAYFLKIKDFIPQPLKDEKYEITSFELEKLWIYHIEPLLEEYLGMSIEDDEIKNKLNKLKEEFLK